MYDIMKWSACVASIFMGNELNKYVELVSSKLTFKQVGLRLEVRSIEGFSLDAWLDSGIQP